MATIDCEEIHTAITTWSGFVYQGKVAIYHVLKLLSANRDSDWFKLQLDSLEDFAILDNSDILQTLHQVKALKKKDYSTYRKAFDKLEERIKTYPCSGAFFHYAVKINNKTVSEIKNLHPTISIYKYHDSNNHCSLDVIDSLNEELIKSYFVKNNLSHRTNPDYLIKTRNYLEDLVQKKVIHIHHLVHKDYLTQRKAAYKETILLQKFIDILEEDLNQKGMDHPYFLHLTRNDLIRYYQEFCLELEDSQEVSIKDKEKLINYLDYINNLDDVHIVDFIRKIMPHREFKFNSITDYKEGNINKEEIKDAFFTTLHDLIMTSDTTNLINWIDNEGNRYIPTTIVACGKKQKQRICERILKNIVDTDLSVAFEEQQMITTEIDVDSVFDCANNIMYVDDPIEELNNKRKSERITQWSKVSLISLDNAKNILNEDDNK